MQSKSTFRPTRAPFGFSRLQLAVLGLAAGLLALSIVGYVMRHDTASPSNHQSAITSSRPAASFRFTEANLLLPEASRAVASTAHMLEINALPGDAASTWPMSLARTRFLEMNQLPGDEMHGRTPSRKRVGP